MIRLKQYRIWISGATLQAAAVALGLAIMFSPIPVESQSMLAPTFSVIHNFSGPEGAEPYAGLTIDGAGNLYGTTGVGGNTGGNCGAGGCGTVFKLTQWQGAWTLNRLYSFAGGNDGRDPAARVVFGPDGSLYGTTASGGNTGGNCGTGGCGTVFKLNPQPTVCKTALCFWRETVLYRFMGGREDGDEPSYGDLVFDQAGSLYGTTILGGSGNCGDSTCGTVYKLTPSGGGWTECLVYSFSGLGLGGINPFGGVILDDAGYLYGTTEFAGIDYNGVVFRLTPTGCQSTETVLWGFSDGPNDGGFPEAGLISDASGNLYGTASDGGPGLGGTVFELVRGAHGWTFKLLYGFTRYGQSQFQGPFGSLTMDADGNLYGTTHEGGAYGLGSVFRLLPNADGTWAYQDLHDFSNNDGRYPVGNVTLDANGNIYGTASEGGGYGLGVVWKITQ